MNQQTKYFIALMSFLSLTVGCIALGTKQTAQNQAAVISQPADTIPPILSQKRINENGIEYVIDTIRCRLTPEHFIQRYAKI